MTTENDKTDHFNPSWNEFENFPQPLTNNILYTVHVSIPLHMFGLMYTHTETPQLQP